jgi:2-methylaconitate cis-trans-isomerase PrpF
LGALNIGLGTRGTIIHDLVYGQRGEVPVGDTVTVRAGHRAGVAESTVRFGKESRRAESVVMSRTAREIMSGNVLIPERIFR